MNKPMREIEGRGLDETTYRMEEIMANSARLSTEIKEPRDSNVELKGQPQPPRPSPQHKNELFTQMPLHGPTTTN